VKKPRRRRDAEQARDEILAAAERRLIQGGLTGIRLQDVAKDAGVSHPTVLHHFGSREGLIKELVSRALVSIHKSLVEAIAASTGEEQQLKAMLDSVSEALTKTGHGRMLLWLALEGERVEDVDVRLVDVVDATHELRTARHKERGCRTPPKEDTAFTVGLAALALLASSVIGEAMLEKAGATGEDVNERFRAWMAKLLLKHLDGDA
jgi:AcrR family transcriptional regulator